MIQLMPFTADEIIEKLEENIKNLPSVTTMLSEGKTPEQILETVLAGFDVTFHETVDAGFVCDCSAERVERSLCSLGDEDVAEWLCLYSVEARIMYMDENILSILQVEETRTERGGWRYFGCTFDLNTGELLKFTDLADISVKDLENILSEVGYPDADNVLSDDYTIVSYRKEMDMTYQFCVDEKYLYLLDNTQQHYRDGVIYRVDEAGKPVMLRYWVEREDDKNRIRLEVIQH